MEREREPKGKERADGMGWWIEENAEKRGDAEELPRPGLGGPGGSGAVAGLMVRYMAQGSVQPQFPR